MYLRYFLPRKRREGRPRLLGTTSASSGPVLEEGSLFSESDWLMLGSARLSLVPFSRPEELAASEFCSSQPGVLWDVTKGSTSSPTQQDTAKLCHTLSLWAPSSFHATLCSDPARGCCLPLTFRHVLGRVLQARKLAGSPRAPPRPLLAGGGNGAAVLGLSAAGLILSWVIVTVLWKQVAPNIRER